MKIYISRWKVFFSSFVNFSRNVFSGPLLSSCCVETCHTLPSYLRLLSMWRDFSPCSAEKRNVITRADNQLLCWWIHHQISRIANFIISTIQWMLNLLHRHLCASSFQFATFSLAAPSAMHLAQKLCITFSLVFHRQFVRFTVLYNHWRNASRSNKLPEKVLVGGTAQGKFNFTPQNLPSPPSPSTPHGARATAALTWIWAWNTADNSQLYFVASEHSCLTEQSDQNFHSARHGTHRERASESSLICEPSWLARICVRHMSSAVGFPNESLM